MMTGWPRPVVSSDSRCVVDLKFCAEVSDVLPGRHVLQQSTLPSTVQMFAPAAAAAKAVISTKVSGIQALYHCYTSGLCGENEESGENERHLL